MDRFVLARLHDAGLKPSPDADPHTWLRRVTLDLVGLPPSPEEIAAFMADTSPLARERVVDRLLASAGFGERWARHWLDLVGYADQLGTVNDVPAPHAWRYRDYVIRSFNADKPFDRFLREQIAGDLLPASDPETRQEAVTATGFLLLGEIHIVTGDKVQLQADIADHQIQKIGTTFLGQTLGCVRCHDHKFDPIPMEDYYGLAGIFGSTESSYVTDRGVWSSILTVELPESETQRAARERAWGEHLVRVEKLKAERAAMKDEIAAIDRKLARPAGSASVTNASIGSGSGTAAPPPPKVADAPDPKARKAELERNIASIDSRLLHQAFVEPRAAFAHAVRDAAEPADGFILVRGNPRAPGRPVARGFVKAFGPSAWPRIPAGRSGRLELADWLADPDQPLPARVTVNRIWQKLFGEGLVRTVDNFGTRGERPTHPELLDWLAGEFIRRGWSQKRVIRELVLSRTYAQASTVDPDGAVRDPENRWLWHMPPRRLEAEALRDAVLAVSGDLKPCSGGPALALHLPENVGGLDPKDPNPISFRTSVIPEEQHRHRTIYLPVVRSRAQPGTAELRDLFDFVPPTAMAGQRPTTSVATQALFLMNGDFVKTQAARLAEWASTQSAPDRAARLDRLYHRVLGRPIRPEEAEAAARFLDGAPGNETDRQRVAWAEYCHALLSSNEFLFRL